MDRDQVTAVSGSLRDPAAAHRMLDENDLVIEATASGPATGMLGDLAQASRRPLVSVCIQRDGAVVRSDRWPLREGERHAVSVAPATTRTELREAGCGDPVSPAPPVAVAEAAALAWRVSVDALSGRFEFPSSVVLVTAPGREPPYDKVGTVA